MMMAPRTPGVTDCPRHTAYKPARPIHATALLFFLATTITGCGSSVDGRPPAVSPAAPTPSTAPPVPTPPVEFHWTVTSPEPDPATSSWSERSLADGLKSTINNEAELLYPDDFWEQDLDFGHIPSVEIQVRAFWNGHPHPIRVQIGIDASQIPVGWQVSPGPVVPSNLEQHHPVVDIDQALVVVGGYGTIVASAETDYGSSSLRIVIPGRNRDRVDLIASPSDRFVIPGPPARRPIHDQCDPENTQRSPIGNWIPVGTLDASDSGGCNRQFSRRLPLFLRVVW